MSTLLLSDTLKRQLGPYPRHRTQAKRIRGGVFTMAEGGNAAERKKSKRVSATSAVNNQGCVNGFSTGSKPCRWFELPVTSSNRIVSE